ISKLTAAPQYSSCPPVVPLEPMASASARRPPSATADQDSGLSRASSPMRPGFVTLVSQAAVRRSVAPVATVVVRIAGLLSSEGHAEVDGDHRGRGDVLGNVAILRIQRVPAHHFGIEETQLVVHPFQIVLRRNDERPAASLRSRN